MSKKQELFWQLLEPEYNKIVGFCYKLTGNKDHGDDLFQDSAIKAILKINRLNENNSFKPWFFKIIVNTYKSKTRKPFWNKMVAITAETEIQSADPTNKYDASRLLEFVLKKLTDDEKALIILFEYEGWPIAEIAKMKKQTENSIKVKLHRIRKKMKKIINVYINESDVTDAMS